MSLGAWGNVLEWLTKRLPVQTVSERRKNELDKLTKLKAKLEQEMSIIRVMKIDIPKAERMVELEKDLLITNNRIAQLQQLLLNAK